MSVERFFGFHLLAGTLPLAAGLLLNGWRALVVVGVVVASTIGATLIWRRVARRGVHVHLPYLLWTSLLLGLTFPAQLASASGKLWGTGAAPWPLLLGAGVLLVAVTWMLGGGAAGRIHPLLVTHLTLVIAFHSFLEPTTVLRPGALFTGDVLQSPGPERRATESRREPWVHSANQPDAPPAVRAEPASRALISYTSARESPERSWTSLVGLIRDRLPPLEDLIIGGNPSPIGSASAAAVILGGLFLIYRGLIDYRIPLIIVVVAFGSFLVLPVPVMITETSSRFMWLAGRHPDIGWATAITFANYELLAGPLLLTAFFIATGPGIRPLTRRGRTVYAMLVGVFCAFFQLYMNVGYGPYVGLLLASLVTPLLDAHIKPRTLV